MASRQRTSSSRCSVLTTQKESSTATGAPIVTTQMRVSVVDPAAYTPPYDRALCAALAKAGAEVELVTAPFPHGEVPPARGYTVREDFYRFAPKGRGRRWARLAQHIPDMLRASRREADVVHFQWLAVQPLDQHLLRAYSHPRVITAHDVLPREPRRRASATPSASSTSAWTRSSCTPSTGAARLVDELGVPGQARARDPARDPAPGRRRRRCRPSCRAYDGTVVLCFGLLRPYKGIDVLVEAWQGIERRRAVDRRRAADGHRAAARGRAAERALRRALRQRGRGGGALPPRRPRRAALPRDRAVRRALHRARVRRAARAHRRRRLPRFRRRRRGRARPAGRRGRAARRPRGPARRPRAPRHAGDGARCACADEAHGWDAIARAHLELYDSLLR